ncbi:MAG: RloB family protein [Lachnospiraceae bacterium]|nr:RloB family protein [Lachnospiraceae bacterium]
MPRLVNGERKIINPKPENASKYIYYEKHLVFDCDAPQDIQNVMLLMKNSDNNYILDYSNLLFETWLVMHFQNILPDGQVDKRSIIRFMREHMEVTRYTDKLKAAKGTIGKILGSNGNERIRAAIANAKILDNYWKERGYDESIDIKKMNPSVNIYKLVERLLDEVVYLCS